jgi:hypothetical protein
MLAQLGSHMCLEYILMSYKIKNSNTESDDYKVHIAIVYILTIWFNILIFNLVTHQNIF